MLDTRHFPAWILSRDSHDPLTFTALSIFDECIGLGPHRSLSLGAAEVALFALTTKKKVAAAYHGYRRGPNSEDNTESDTGERSV